MVRVSSYLQTFPSGLLGLEEEFQRTREHRWRFQDTKSTVSKARDSSRPRSKMQRNLSTDAAAHCDACRCCSAHIPPEMMVDGTNMLPQ